MSLYAQIFLSLSAVFTLGVCYGWNLRGRMG